MSNISPTFCTLPWNTLTGQKNGKIGVCCMNSLARDNEELGDISQTRLSDIWNSEKIKKLRQNMVEGKKSSYCTGCYKKEAKGLVSLRTKSLEYDKHEIGLYLDKTSSDGSYTGGIKKLDIRFSNLCNLACRMCSGHSSTKRIPLDKQIGIQTTDIYTNEPYDIVNFWNDTKLFTSLEVLKFAGGEPLINKNFYKLLEKMIEEGLNTKISIQILTNLTVLPGINGHEEFLSGKFGNVLEMLQSFSSYIIFVSIDGYEDSYEHIRIGAKWKNVKDNIISTHKYLKDSSTGQLEFVPTIQIDNIYDFPKLYIFAKKLNIKIDIKPLIRPEFLSIVNILEEEKENIKKYYLECIDKYRRLYPEIEEDFQYILQYMFSSISDEYMQGEYQEKSKIMDHFSKTII